VPTFAQLLCEVHFELTEKTTASGSRSHDRPPGGQAAKLPRARAASGISMRRGCSAGSGDKAGSDTRVKSRVRKRSRPRLPFKNEKSAKPGNTARVGRPWCNFSFSVRISGHTENRFVLNVSACLVGYCSAWAALRHMLVGRADSACASVACEFRGLT
jgi:hypothetical protein